MRLIDADALKREWKLGNACENCQQDAQRCEYRYDYTLMDICSMLDDAPTVGVWVSVKDRLPSIAECVLIFETRYGIQTIAKGYFDHDAWWIAGWGMASGIVTHWMPLPEPPQEGKQP